MPIADINRTQIHFADQGNGPAIVLVHGFPLNHAMWKRQVEALSKRFRVIAMDVRGFGRSAPTGPFTIETIADDVHALAEHLKLGTFVLGGLSMGGYVVLAYAGKYPATLRGLMLVDTRAEADSAPVKENRDKMIATARQQGARPISDAMLGRLIPEATAKSRADLVGELRQMMESCAPEAIAHALEAMRDRPDYVSSLAGIAVPTLILSGELDAITPPEVMKVLHDNIPRSQFAIIPGSGHMSPMEQPNAVTREMERFLATL